MCFAAAAAPAAAGLIAGGSGSAVLLGGTGAGLGLGGTAAASAAGQAALYTAIGAPTGWATAATAAAAGQAALYSAIGYEAPATFLGLTNAQWAAQSLASQTLGAGVQFLGQRGAAQSAALQARYQAELSRRNIAIADFLARDAIGRGEAARKKNALLVKSRTGYAKADFAARGVSLEPDETAGDYLADIGEAGLRDDLIIQENAEREALGFKTQALNFQSQADLYDTRSSIDPLTGVGTVLAGASAITNRFATFRQRGIL